MIRLKAESYSGKKQKTIKSKYASVSIVEYDASSVSLGMHYHDNAHISFILSGTDKEKRNGNSYYRNIGDLFFYQQGQIHGTLSQTGKTRNLIIELTQSFEYDYKCDFTTLEFNNRMSSLFKLKLVKLFGEIIYNDNLLPLTLETLMSELSSIGNYRTCKKMPEWHKTIIEIINDNWNNVISLTELSQAVNVHPVTISKYFNVYNNCTLTNYIKGIRIARSFTLLQNTNLSLTEIAFECGFSDQSHFIRVFKAITGYSPNKIRKACNGKS
jgi:AraC family transcriptional regulator